MKIQLIIGSVRQGRIGPQIACWIKRTLLEIIQGADIDVIDLKEWHLPMDDEPGYLRQGIMKKNIPGHGAGKFRRGKCLSFLHLSITGVIRRR